MKLIPGLDGPSLFATEDGRIVLVNGHQRRVVITPIGYVITHWRGKNYFVHRLVAAAYLGLDLKNLKLQVNHKDSNKLNNSVSNLELVTPWENIQHFIKSKEPKPPKMRERPAPKKWYERPMSPVEFVPRKKWYE